VVWIATTLLERVNNSAFKLAEMGLCHQNIVLPPAADGESDLQIRNVAANRSILNEKLWTAVLR
jgi:hypothetical protein